MMSCLPFSCVNHSSECDVHRSWNKFVRLYYVDEIVCNDTALTITITMTVDRDLRLQFADRGQYVSAATKITQTYVIENCSHACSLHSFLWMHICNSQSACLPAAGFRCGRWAWSGR
jgi:hypothetical protein